MPMMARTGGTALAYIRYSPGDVLVTPGDFAVLNSRYLKGENIDVLARSVCMSDRTLRREFSDLKLPQRKHGPQPRAK
jgi:hypothetical protein